jgi:hypothetical protein
MNTKKLMVAVMLASLTGLAALDAATARVRTVRARNTAAAVAATSTPEERTERQDSRQERWNDASPNQRAATYNVAKTRHQQNVTRQAAAVSRRR